MMSNVVLSSENDALLQPKILVVDDLKENIRVFNNILAEINAEIFCAHSGEEAISLSLRHQFAVILLDVMMPGMDGYETADLLRVNEDTRYTPIIFVTAMEPNDEFENRGYDVGAVDYLFKPIKPQALIGKVRVFIELEKQRHKIKNTLVDIQRLEKRNDLLLKSVGEGILGLDQKGSITFSNPASQSLLGYSEHEMDGMNIMDILCATSTEKYETKWEECEAYIQCKRGLGHHENIGVFFDKQNSPFPVEYLATPIREMSNEEFVGVVIAFQDVTERKKAQDQLARLAQIDTLTGLYNRYAFSKQLSQSLARGERQHQPLALLFIDLDNFKQINDNLGHEAGDLLLRECADRLVHCVRDGDILSRIGGDEFTAIIESIEGGRNIATIANKIINALSRPFKIKGNEVFASASIGIATYPESAEDAGSLLRCSDIAMYKAKESGRNTFQFFTEAMQQEVSCELALENALRNALPLNQFVVFYQPKINPINNAVIGAEALLRWRCEDGSLVTPDNFISKAEEMGLIQDIGNWVMTQSCQQVQEWKKLGYFNSGETIAVNLSIRQLMVEDLAKEVEEILQKTSFDAGNLELEITEGMMMQNPAACIKILNTIHELGVKVAIDDFGTGYSSLAYLRDLPIDCLKIDKSFVQALGKTNGDAIVNAIINLGQNLSLNVVAEGAETEEQVEFLKKHGVDTIQGYFYSKPISAEEFTVLLEKNKLLLSNPESDK